MPFTQQQIRTAQAQQHQAAHDPSPQVRVIAGPGTGKTFTIQERVCWFLGQGIPPDSIFVVSFTRATARDLRDRVRSYCLKCSHPEAENVSVSTLHSLALRALRAAGLLVYPADPLVLDDWELEYVHDHEFSSASGFRPGRPGGGYSLSRAKVIREEFEAFCGTGQRRPPGYILPSPLVSQSERAAYKGFHQSRTQLYSCVLPGEIVRQCVDNIAAGVLDPARLLGMSHLVVDEYQDLNPTDLSFVDSLISRGVVVFVAGDDDQSLYSFRYASPQGIQSFLTRHPNAGGHQLTHCFRCTPNVLSCGQNLVTAYATQDRVPKQTSSLYMNSQPPEPGIVHRLGFPSGVAEARFIAESCRDLISAGVPHREILILISNTRALLSGITRALDAAGVPYESPRGETYLDTRPGRFIFSIVRIACDQNDYVAHRVLLGARPGVGPGTCNAIAESAIANYQNYRELFYQPLPQDVFSGRPLTALTYARTTCSIISGWGPDDTIGQRLPDMDSFVTDNFGRGPADSWQTEIAHLPTDMSLTELRDYLWADNDEQRAFILGAVYERLGLEVPHDGFLPPQIRIMTIHGAKGLSARVVFVPGLEDPIIPGPRRQPYPGLVLEAARMLYVSITRARAACILSYAGSRIIYGEYRRHPPSRFASRLSGQFLAGPTSLTSQEVAQIVQSCTKL